MQLPLTIVSNEDCHSVLTKESEERELCRFFHAGLGNLTARDLLLVGLNHRTAPLSVRSRVGLAPDRQEEFLQELREKGAQECAVVCTCNRTEVYVLGLDSDTVLNTLASYAGMDAEDLREHIYHKKGICTICHLFRVASGLDSAVLGETEIVSQVKQGWRLAADHELTGNTMDLVFQRALEASKRVRTETELCRSVTSVGSLAVREAENRTGSLEDSRVLVIGSGQIAERIVKELSATEVQQVLVLNRTVERAEELAERFGYAYGGLESLETALEAADVVFTTVTAEKPLITEEDLARTMSRRDGKSLILVDLGVPPNVEPGLAVEGVESIDMDSLVAVCATNSERRITAVPAALAILDDEMERIKSSLKEREAAATIKALLQHGDDVKERSLTWALERLPELTAKEARTVQDLSRRIVLGVLTPLMEELKSGATSEDRATIERLFRLSGSDSE